MFFSSHFFFIKFSFFTHFAKLLRATMRWRSLNRKEEQEGWCCHALANNFKVRGPQLNSRGEKQIKYYTFISVNWSNFSNLGSTAPRRNPCHGPFPFVSTPHLLQRSFSTKIAGSRGMEGGVVTNISWRFVANKEQERFRQQGYR